MAPLFQLLSQSLAVLVAQPYQAWLLLVVGMLLTWLAAAHLITLQSDRDTCTDYQLAAQVRERDVFAFSGNDPNFQHPLRDYYVQTARDAAVASNGWEVTPCALRRRLARGIRGLHFRARLGPDDPDASPAAHVYSRAQSRAFHELFETCARSAFHPRTAPNASDPVLMYLDIDTPTLRNDTSARRRAFLDSLVATLAFRRDLLLGPEHSFRAVLTQPGRPTYTSRAPLHTLQNRIVVLANHDWVKLVHREFPEHPFLDYVNLSVGSSLMEEFSPSSSPAWPDVALYSAYNVAAMSPAAAETALTPTTLRDWRRRGGLQWIPLTYGTERKRDAGGSVAAEDAAFFRAAQHAFVLKPATLRRPTQPTSS